MKVNHKKDFDHAKLKAKMRAVKSEFQADFQNEKRKWLHLDLHSQLQYKFNEIRISISQNGKRK